MSELQECINNIIQCFINYPVQTYEQIEKYGLSPVDLKQLNHERKLFAALVKCFFKYKTITKEAVKVSLSSEYGALESNSIMSNFFTNKECNMDDVHVHIKLIKTASIRNNLIKEVDNLKKSIINFNEDGSLSDLYIDVSTKTNTIHSYLIDSTESVVKIGDHVDELKKFFTAPGSLYVPTGYPLFDMVIGGGLRKGITLVEARSGVGKCINSFNTVLYGTFGLLHPFELHDVYHDIKIDNLKYKLMNETLGLSQPAYWWNNGKSKTIKITTKYGYTLEMTPNHPIRVLNNDGDIVWKKASEICVSDIVPVKYNTNIYGNKNENNLSLDDAYVIGCIVGDGSCIANNTSVSLTNVDISIIDKFTRFVNKNGFKVISSKRKGGTKYLQHTCSNKEFSDKIRSYGFYKNRFKIIPKCIRESSKDIICSCLSGLFDTDGTVNNRNVSLTTKSEILSTEVQSLLLNLGIISSTRERMIKIPNKNIRKKYYEVRITNGEDLRIFRDLIGFNIEYKKNKLNNLISLNVPSGNNGRNLIPNCKKLLKQIKDLLKDNSYKNGSDLFRQKSTLKMVATGAGCSTSTVSSVINGNRKFKSSKKMTQKIKNIAENLEYLPTNTYSKWTSRISDKDGFNNFRDAINKYIRGKSRPQKESILKILSYIGFLENNESYIKLKELSNNNTLYDSVKKIEYGEEYTCDFYIPETHNFITNGIISHNTIYGINVAYYMALTGHDVLYLDAELEKEYFTTRLLSLVSGIPIKFIEDSEKWRTNKEISNYLNLIMDTVIKKLPIHYKYIGGLSLNTILCYIKQFAQAYKESMPAGVYDYLLVTNANDYGGKLSETQIIGNMMSQIQDINVRYEFPLLLLSQTNRSGSERTGDDTTAMSDRVLWRSSSSCRLHKVEASEAEALGYDRFMTFAKTRYAGDFHGKIKYRNMIKIGKLEELPDTEV